MNRTVLTAERIQSLDIILSDLRHLSQRVHVAALKPKSIRPALGEA